MEFSSQSSDELLPGHPRVHEVGREYYERNIKSSDWHIHSTTEAESKPDARLRTVTARDIAVKNRGCMQDNLQGYADPPIVKRIHPRGVKPEAYKIAEVNRGRGLKSLLDNYGNLGTSARPGPKVKGSEAEEYKEREHGSTKFLLNHFSTDPIPVSELPLPHRLRLGGEEVAQKHKGEQMGPLLRLEGKKTPKEPKMRHLHQVSTGSGWDEAPPHHRTRPEAEDIAQKNSADSINDIILQNVYIPPQRKQPKILKHLAESASPRKAPPHRVRLDGVEILEKAMNQTEMSAIMHGCPRSLLLQPNSIHKVLPHLQKSQLW